MTKIKNGCLEIFNFIRRIFNTYNLNLVKMLERYIQDCKNILDLGCGPNSRIGIIKKKYQYTVGVDIDKKSIEISKSKKIHDKYYLLNISDIEKIAEEKSYDCVILIDVIEHLKRLDAIRLIVKIEKIAKKRIIIFTPNGYIHLIGNKNNIYLRHLSGWNVKTFKKMNFKVFGINGLKILRRDECELKYKPRVFWNKVSSLTNIIILKIPQFAFHLFCVKEVNK